jgi:hypothetical protein
MQSVALEVSIKYCQLSRIKIGVINIGISYLLAFAKVLKIKPSELFLF